MADQLTLAANSPLAGKDRFDGEGISLFEQPLAMIRLQGRADDPQFNNGVRAAVGVDLPPPGVVAGASVLRLHWLTPQEFLLVAPLADEQKWLAALLGQSVSAGLITDSRVTIAVIGPHAATLLMQACALDLHDSQFPVNRGTVTRAAGIAAMITRVADTGYEVTIDRSHARYMWDWLQDSVQGL